MNVKRPALLRASKSRPWSYQYLPYIDGPLICEIVTNFVELSLQKAPSRMKLSSMMPVLLVLSSPSALPLRYEYTWRRTSQFALAPSTLVIRLSEDSGGREI